MPISALHGRPLICSCPERQRAPSNPRSCCAGVHRAASFTFPSKPAPSPSLSKSSMEELSQPPRGHAELQSHPVAPSISSHTSRETSPALLRQHSTLPGAAKKGKGRAEGAHARGLPGKGTHGVPGRGLHSDPSWQISAFGPEAQVPPSCADGGSHTQLLQFQKACKLLPVEEEAAGSCCVLLHCAPQRRHSLALHVAPMPHGNKMQCALRGGGVGQAGCKLPSTWYWQQAWRLTLFVCSSFPLAWQCMPPLRTTPQQGK